METTDVAGRIRRALGEPYEVAKRDGKPIVLRELGNGYVFEVHPQASAPEEIQANLLIRYPSAGEEPVEGIYGIRTLTDLKDVLGAMAIKYQELGSCCFR